MSAAAALRVPAPTGSAVVPLLHPEGGPRRPHRRNLIVDAGYAGQRRSPRRYGASPVLGSPPLTTQGRPGRSARHIQAAALGVGRGPCCTASPVRRSRNARSPTTRRIHRTARVAILEGLQIDIVSLDVIETISKHGELGREILLLRQALRPSVSEAVPQENGVDDHERLRLAVARRIDEAIRRACRITTSR